MTTTTTSCTPVIVEAWLANARQALIGSKLEQFDADGYFNNALSIHLSFQGGTKFAFRRCDDVAFWRDAKSNLPVAVESFLDVRLCNVALVWPKNKYLYSLDADDMDQITLEFRDQNSDDKTASILVISEPESADLVVISSH